MSSQKPSIRAIASQSGFSVATVSEALRGTRKVKPATAKAILDVAERMGYKRNTLVGNVMSRLRQSQTEGYRGNIAILDTASFREQRKVSLWHRDMFEGARKRAEELGFKMEFVLIDTYSQSLGRLQQVLYHRGINGLFLPPFLRRKDFDGFDWSLFSVVQMDYCLRKLRMHSVMPDHHLSIFNSLQRLEQLGYRRPGLIVEHFQDERIFMKWLGGYRSFERVSTKCEAFPAFQPRTFSPAKLLEWLRRFKPDVLVGHRGDVIDWLKDAGIRVPEDVGFFSLNRHYTARDVAGLNLRPDLLGSVAIDLLVSQIHLDQCGVPNIPQTIMLEGEWVDRPTLRYDLPNAERPLPSDLSD